MKTIAALGIGFFIGRHYTRKYYEQKDHRRKIELEQKIINIIEDLGGSKSEAKTTTQNLLATQ